MHHRWVKMLLDGKPNLVGTIRSPKEKKDVVAGDAVEYRSARKLAEIWKKAVVLGFNGPTIELSTPEKQREKKLEEMPAKGTKVWRRLLIRMYLDNQDEVALKLLLKDMERIMDEEEWDLGDMSPKEILSSSLDLLHREEESKE